ncbi:MAG: type II secretion system F family protein [Tepidisphaeraceae bacterium]|jgi:type IV pilus assembly protein PilC
MPNASAKLRPAVPGLAIALIGVADVFLIGLIFAVGVEEPVWTAIFIALAIVASAGFLWVAIRKMGSAASFRLLAIAATFFVLVLLVGACFFAPDATPLIIYAVAFLAIVLMALSGVTRVIRQRRMLLILGNVEKAVRMQLPIPRMIEAAAQGERGLMRRRLLDLHDLLDRGEPLDQALIYAVPEIPRGVVRSIAAGQRLGCLDHVLDAIIRRRSNENAAYRPSAGFYWAYPVVLIGVVSLVMVFVIPKYKSIFADFHTQLPPVTKLLLAISNWFATQYGWAYVLPLFLLIFFGRMLASLFPSVRDMSPLRGLFTDRIVWWTPIMRGLVRDRGMADLCDIVGAGVGAGHPLDEALREAADAQPNSVMRRRAAAWAAAVNSGQSMQEAARHARMPELFAAMLATVRGDDSLRQVLAFLWRHYEYRFSRARAVLQAAYVPAIVFFFGSLVALVGVAIIQPIAMLIRVIGGY